MRTAPLAHSGSGTTGSGLKPQQPHTCIPYPDGKPDGRLTDEMVSVGAGDGAGIGVDDTGG